MANCSSTCTLPYETGCFHRIGTRCPPLFRGVACLILFSSLMTIPTFEQEFDGNSSSPGLTYVAKPATESTHSTRFRGSGPT
jgi:hypothetical protein